MNEKEFEQAKQIATKIVDQLNLNDIGESMVAIAMVIEAITVNTLPKENWLDSIDAFYGILKERLKDKMQEQGGLADFFSNLMGI